MNARFVEIIFYLILLIVGVSCTPTSNISITDFKGKVNSSTDIFDNKNTLIYFNKTLGVQTFSGPCVKSGSTVQLSVLDQMDQPAIGFGSKGSNGSSTWTTDCRAGTWQIVLDTTSASDGEYKISAQETLRNKELNSAQIRAIKDTSQPSVVQVGGTGSSPSGTYAAGALIDLLVEMSEPVTVSGLPTLALNTAPPQVAKYVSGSGTSHLLFRYTVTHGDISAHLDYTQTSDLHTGDGSISDIASNPANATLPARNQVGSLAANTKIVIAAIPTPTQQPTPPTFLSFGPTPNSLSQTPVISFLPGGDSTGGVLIPTTNQVQLHRFSDNSVVVPWVSANPDVSLKYLALLHGVEYYAKFRAVRIPGILTPENFSNEVTSTSTFTASLVDVLPTLTTAALSPTKTAPIRVHLNFNFAVTGLTSNLFTTSNATLQNLTGSGTDYTFDLQPSVLDGTVSVSLNANLVKDSWQNPNVASNNLSLTFDSVAPTAVLRGEPLNASNSASLSVDVLGTNGVVFYKYKLGASATTNCSESLGYSTTLIAEALNIIDILTGLSDGPLTLCVLGQDVAGNIQDLASPTMASWMKDTQSPAIAISMPASGASINANTQISSSLLAGNLKMGGSCSENGSPVNIIATDSSSGGSGGLSTGVVTTSFTCNSGLWSGFADLSSLVDGNITITAQQKDLAGNTGSANLNLLKDTQNPSVTLTTPATHSYINLITVASFALGGTCSEPTQNVILIASNSNPSGNVGLGTISGSATCLPSYTWSTTLDLSSLMDGNVTVHVDHSDLASNQTAYSITLIKDTLAPVNPTFISINPVSPDASTTPHLVGSSSTDTSTVIIYNNSLCTGVLASTTKNVFDSTGITLDLPAAATTSLYARAKDAAGNLSACALMTDYINNSTPICQPGSLGIVSEISAGGNHTCAIEKLSGTIEPGGTVKCWGINTSGELGNGSGGLNQKSQTPVEVLGLTNILSLAAGSNYTCAIEKPSGAIEPGGSVKCWGDNTYGQFGDGLGGSGIKNLIPIAAGNGLTNIISLAAGALHTCALVNAGSIKCWGYNLYGQLGNGNNINSNTPVSPGLSGIKSLAAGSYHTCALDNTGSVKCWGRNNHGQLGDNTTIDKTNPVTVAGLSGIIGIAAGTSHTCALETGGTVKCWGLNNSGQLGDNTTTEKTIPNIVAGLSSIMSIAAGAQHTCAVESGGTVKCWGFNSEGQTGNNINIINLSPKLLPGVSGIMSLTAGDSHTCAANAIGTVQCWGNNNSGQLGINIIDNIITEPVLATGLADFKFLAAGPQSTCAIHSNSGNNSVNCWGDNSFGQLGDNSTTFRHTVPASIMTVPTNQTVLSGLTSIAMGSFHTCATGGASGDVSCWGDNRFSQLGSGTLSGITSLAAGIDFTCGLNSAGTVKCWGNNNVGQLGIGFGTLGIGITTSSIPQDVAFQRDALGLPRINSLVSGNYHSCALDSNGQVYCWGLGDHGQLGTGVLQGASSDVPVNVPMFLASGENVQSLAAGAHHNCALVMSATGSPTGTVKCWGSHDRGQLGMGGALSSNNPSPSNVINSPSTSPAALSDITMITAGTNHTCGLDSSGSVYCWGDNNFGQLGANPVSLSFSTSPVSVLITPPNSSNTRITSLVAGGNHTCALYAAGASGAGPIKCWGDNNEGQLGFVRPPTLVPRVIFGLPAKLNFATNLAPLGINNSLFKIQPVVKIYDACNNFLNSATDPVTISASNISDCSQAAGGSIRTSSNNPLNAVGGTASFTGVSYMLDPLTNLTETIYLKASAPGLTSACSTTPTEVQTAKQPINFISSATGNSTANATVNVPTGTQAGHTMFAVVAAKNPGPPPSGWTEISTSVANGNVTQKIFYRVADNTDLLQKSYDFDGRNNPTAATIITFSGVSTTANFQYQLGTMQFTNAIQSATSITTFGFNSSNNPVQGPLNVTAQNPMLLDIFSIDTAATITMVPSATSSTDSTLATVLQNGGNGKTYQIAVGQRNNLGGPFPTATTDITATFSTVSSAVGIQLLLYQAP